MIKHIPLRLRDFGGGVFVCKNGDGYCKKCGKGVKQQNKKCEKGGKCRKKCENIFCIIYG